MWPIGFFVTWQRIICFGLEDVLDAGVLLHLDVVGVEVDVAAVQHGVLRRGDVDERRFHAGQHVLDATEIDVAVDLADVVGRAGDVVLDERSAFEHGDVGVTGSVDVHVHLVAPDGTAVALAALTLLERLGVELDPAVVVGQHRLDRGGRRLSLTAAALSAALATALSAALAALLATALVAAALSSILVGAALTALSPAALAATTAATATPTALGRGTGAVTGGAIAASGSGVAGRAARAAGGRDRVADLRFARGGRRNLRDQRS